MHSRLGRHWGERPLLPPAASFCTALFHAGFCQLPLTASYAFSPAVCRLPAAVFPGWGQQGHRGPPPSLLTWAAPRACRLAPEVAKGSSALQSVFGLLDRRPAIDAEDPKAKSLATVTGTIDLSHVTFRYPSRPDVTVFNDFSLHVPAGRTVALVGQSGSGKSTIVSLVER